MIKIVKPAEPPEVLRTRGVKKRAVHCQSYTRYATEYDNGTRTFPFDDTIYNHASVKQALVDAQHSKCCFCERKIGHDGDVEHFRPKAGYCQGVGMPLMRPGYYWLAYDWDNLLLSCSACNQRFKRNYFPLANPTKRARSHQGKVRLEEPLYIHPANTNPEDYIGFRKEIPYAINGNPHGKLTIASLRLDREILNEVRRDRLAMLVAMRNIVDLENELRITSQGRKAVSDAQAFLARSISDASEFASMARAAKANDFRVTIP